MDTKKILTLAICLIFTFSTFASVSMMSCWNDSQNTQTVELENMDMPCHPSNSKTPDCCADMSSCKIPVLAFTRILSINELPIAKIAYHPIILELKTNNSPPLLTPPKHYS